MDNLSRSALALAILLPFGASCTGAIGESTGDPDSPTGGSAGGGPGGMGPGTSPAPGPESAGVLGLQRLSQREYSNTIRDLLGKDFVADVASFATSLRQTSGDAGFDVPLDDATSHIGDIWGVAEKLAARAAPNLVASCDAAKMTMAACAQKIIADFGRRAFRRPLEDVELQALQGVFAKAMSADVGLDYQGAIALLVQGLLQSPNFLYHWEAGSAPQVPEGVLIKLSAHQIASRLSYLLWGTMPDPKLFAAADANQLGTPEGIAEQVKWMVRDPRFAETASDFHHQWLATGTLANLVRNGSQADPKRYEDFTRNQVTYAQSMDGELNAFTAYVLQGAGDGRLRTLLTAPFSFVNTTLAKIYGYKGATGATLTRKDLDPTERAGILTQTAFLASKAGTQTSSPVLRGVWIFKHLLCRQVGQPNMDEVNKAKKELPAVSDPETTRENFERLTSSKPVCVGCHQILNPFGWAFEHYGAIGELRNQDNGKPVNASTTVTLDGKEANFNDAIQLVQALAGSEEVRRCVASQWFRYALGRLETEPEKASLGVAARRFSRTDGDLRDLLVAISQSKAFRYRSQ